MQERRRFIRLTARLEALFAMLPHGQMRPVQVKDMSASGIRLATDAAVPPGTELQLSVQLPGRERQINALAEVVWSEPHETVDKTERQRGAETGARYREIAPVDRAALEAFVSAALNRLIG